MILGEILSQKRNQKNISLHQASRALLIKEEILESLENGDYQRLPEPAFVRGFIKNYANYLGLDASHLLALFRREYDERKYPKKNIPLSKRPIKVKRPPFSAIFFILMVLIFLLYLLFQYLSILSAPKLTVASPPDELTTSIPAVDVSGQTEKDSAISINGQLVPVSPDGTFSYQYQLKDGKNTIEIIASKKLSPKSKVTKIVRLTR